ncbi:hypothetical protein VP01_1658g2 [Puccinia sorghi]|uniref:Uncharacterized protein n=1 Tax=Puccinia sorghi TaxID=27349 RepID=A0A0L6VGX5_9BASI|nr:hypothetical protein VP01_1658g2 [Puccinia sorghi]
MSPVIRCLLIGPGQINKNLMTGDIRLLNLFNSVASYHLVSKKKLSVMGSWVDSHTYRTNHLNFKDLIHLYFSGLEIQTFPSSCNKQYRTQNPRAYLPLPRNSHKILQDLHYREEYTIKNTTPEPENKPLTNPPCTQKWTLQTSKNNWKCANSLRGEKSWRKGMWLILKVLSVGDILLLAVFRSPKEGGKKVISGGEQVAKYLVNPKYGFLIILVNHLHSQVCLSCLRGLLYRRGVLIPQTSSSRNFFKLKTFLNLIKNLQDQQCKNSRSQRDSNLSVKIAFLFIMLVSFLSFSFFLLINSPHFFIFSIFLDWYDSFPLQCFYSLSYLFFLLNFILLHNCKILVRVILSSYMCSEIQSKLRICLAMGNLYGYGKSICMGNTSGYGKFVWLWEICLAMGKEEKGSGGLIQGRCGRCDSCLSEDEEHKKNKQYLKYQKVLNEKEIGEKRNNQKKKKHNPPNPLSEADNLEKQSVKRQQKEIGKDGVRSKLSCESGDQGMHGVHVEQTGTVADSFSAACSWKHAFCSTLSKARVGQNSDIQRLERGWCLIWDLNVGFWMCQGKWHILVKRPAVPSCT